jgi:hypothetical protein
MALGTQALLQTTGKEPLGSGPHSPAALGRVVRYCEKLDLHVSQDTSTGRA